MSPIVFDKPLILDIPLYIVLVFLSQEYSPNEYLNFGAEDYKLVAAVPKDFLQKLSEYEIIGEVIKKQDYTLRIGDKKYYNYNELDLYNHFGEEEWRNFH